MKRQVFILFFLVLGILFIIKGNSSSQPQESQEIPYQGVTLSFTYSDQIPHDYKPQSVLLPHTKNATQHKTSIAKQPILPSSDSCKENGGFYRAEFHECERLSQTWCDQNNGTYTPCASVCRHQPETIVCTRQCVKVCQL